MKNKDTSETDLELFRDLINKSNDAIFVNDPRTGLFIFVNDKACAALGYDRRELLTMGVPDIETTFPDNFSWQAHVNELRLRGTRVLEGAHRRKDGAIIPVEANVSYVVLNTREYMVAIVRDITEHKRSAEALKAREKQLAESQRIAHIGSWEHNLKTGEVFWSDELFRLLGLDSKTDQADFGMFFDMVHPDDQPMLKKAIDETLRDKKPFGVDYRYILRDGTTRIIHARAELVRDDAGDLVILSGTGQDMTERKHAEEQLRSALTEKETLLRELHHRTKNNMQVIMSLINLQIASVSNKQDAYLLNDTQNRIMSMALVHEKLYGSRDLSNVNLKNYVEGLASSLLRSYKVDTNKIVQIIEVDDMVLSIDTIIPIGLIITELMSNTLKYAFPGNGQEEIRISAHSFENGEIELTYGDNGIGFPADFDFKKTDSLGLKLVHNLVKSQLQGRLTLKTDKGSEFVIRFKEPERKKRI